MIDSATIENLIQDEIKNAVNRNVEHAMDDPSWQQAIEKQITEFMQGRIAAKFRNLENLPEIVDIVRLHIEQMFEQGKVPGIKDFVDIKHIKSAIDCAVHDLVSASLDQLLADSAWLARLQASIEINMATRISQQLSSIDLNSAVSVEVQKNIDRWRHELGQNFQSTGIRDLATACELVISDGAVVATNALACDNMMVQNALTVQHLAVTGSVNVDCASWNELASSVAAHTQEILGEQWQQQLVSQVLDLAKTRGISFDQINLQGTPLVQGNRLNSTITHSAITKLGVVQELVTKGPADLSDTMTVNGGRVGINTDSPDMALSVWDEEVCISLGKISRDRAWIGSNRDHTVDIGTNRRRAITIEPDGLVVIDKLRLDRWRISYANAVPNYSGTRGDLVINHDPRPNSPFAWQCLGGFKWQPLNLASEPV